MKQLTCEMCGSTDLIKQDGVFVCQTCGCKYSLEEAKKMMIEGVVEVTGTVKVDNTDSIENYLSMARNACNSGNYSEAESYCNRILEMDVENWEAWFIKGKAVGWQSSNRNTRIGEAINVFIKALLNCPVEMQNALAGECNLEIIKLYSALISIRLDTYCRFIRDRDDEDGQKITSVITEILNMSSKTAMNIASSSIGNKTKKISAEAAEKFMGFSPIDKQAGMIYANVIEKAMEKALAEVKLRYGKIEHPDLDDYKRFTYDILNIAWGECNMVIHLDMKKKYDDSEINALIIHLYEKAIEISMLASNLVIYIQRYENGRTNYYPMTADDGLVKTRDEWKKSLSEIKRIAPAREAAAARKRTEEYWNSHVEEREKLTSEKGKLISEKDSLQKTISELEFTKNGVPAKPYLDEISNRIATLQNYKNTVPGLMEKANLEAFISDLQNKISKLGIFKRKEKKDLEWQIENAKRRIPEVQKMIDYQIAGIDAQIAPIEAERSRLQSIVSQQQGEIEKGISPYREKLKSIMTRIAEIDNELTKPR